MVCTSCSSEMSSSTQFCPQCGNPAVLEAEPEPATATATGVSSGRVASAGTTQVLDLPGAAQADATAAQPAVAAPAVAGPAATGRAPGVPWGERAATAVAPVRRWLADSGLEVQLAIGGTLLVLLAFFFLPFADELGTAAEIGGRVWWRPITAVTATVLLVLALRREIPPSGAQARVVSALALATAGATEAGLLGLVTGNGAGLHAGYYLMLLGLVVVLLAAFLATRHPVRRLTSGD
jgi:hypothetical protein